MFARTAPDTNRNTGAIRDLLTGAFNDEELTALCFDAFPEIYEDFAAGMSKRQKIQRLLDHCIRHDRLAQLLDHVREQNPRQYADYAERFEIVKLPLSAAYHPSVLPELPADLRGLILHNRAKELAVLGDHVTTHRVTTITGMGGIGKTTLARALVELRPADVPPPMWVNFADEPDSNLDSVLGRFAGYLNWPELLNYRQERRQPGRSDVARLTDRLFELPPCWIILDNLESVLDGEGHFCDAGLEALFEALVGHQHRARLIVSSRMLPALRNINVMASGLGQSTLELRGLSRADGITLLCSQGLAEVSEAQLARLVERVSGHPLVLWFLLTEAQVWGIAKLLAESDLWQTGDIAQFAHQLFSRLLPTEQRLLAFFSVFRQPQPPSLLVALASNGAMGQQTVRLLIRKSLLSVARSGDPPLYSLHPLVRELAEAELDADKRRQAHLLACQHYLSLRLPPMSAWRGMDDIMSLLEAHYHALQAGALDRAATILLEYALPDHLEQWGLQERLIKLCQLTFGQAPEGISYAMYLADIGYDKLQNSGSDTVRRASLYRLLGKCARYLNEYGRALASYEQGLDALHTATDTGELIRLYSESAFLLHRLGRRQEALERCRRGLQLVEGVRDRQSQIDRAGLYLRAGVVAGALGDQSEAFNYFQQTYTIYQALGLALRAYEAYDNMGIALQRQGRFQEALSYATSVLQYYEKIDHRLGAAQAGLNAGSALHYLQRYEEARPYYHDALERFQDIGDQQGCLLGLYNLGELLMDMGDDESALPYLEQALAVSKAIGQGEDQADILWLFGNAYVHLGQIASARSRLEQAAAAAAQSDNRQVREESEKLLAELTAKDMNA